MQEFTQGRWRSVSATCSQHKIAQLAELTPVASEKNKAVVPVTTTQGQHCTSKHHPSASPQVEISDAITSKLQLARLLRCVL